MRTFSKPNYDWLMNFTELREICEEVYGVPLDIQMGERGQGEYDIVTTGEIDSIQGYWRGMGNKGYRHEDKYLPGAEWKPFVEGDSEEAIEEGERLAIEKWKSQTQREWSPGRFDWDRPFDKVGDNGEYTFYQPDTDVVLTDLVKKGEIPPGTYMITIDW